jgi:hypothetical protein
VGRLSCQHQGAPPPTAVDGKCAYFEAVVLAEVRSQRAQLRDLGAQLAHPAASAGFSASYSPAISPCKMF